MKFSSVIVNIFFNRRYLILLYVRIKVRAKVNTRFTHQKNFFLQPTQRKLKFLLTKEVSKKGVPSLHPANVSVSQDYLLNATNSKLFSHDAGEISHAVLTCIQVLRSTSAGNKMKLNTRQLHMPCYNLFSTQIPSFDVAATNWWTMLWKKETISSLFNSHFYVFNYIWISRARF